MSNPIEPQANFVWYELMTSDAMAAEHFYREVVGWGAQPQPGPNPYTLLTVDDVPVAGLMNIPDEAAGMRPGWIGYIGVADVDAAAQKLQSLGGAVHRAPADIPGVGRFAVVADPQGASFVLFSGLPGMTAPPPSNKPGHAGWRELMATDWESAFEFYSALCGWTKDTPFDMGEMGIYQLFAVKGEMIGGMMTKPASLPTPFWSYYFNVDGIDAAIERTKAGGGSVLMGPSQVPGDLWVVQAKDPQGAMFCLLSPTK